ncbi:MAG: ribulose-phosphate 3-epimerase [Clostridia bacterium]|nr:ribulose-phosphate 3-epimerase [Clostridia bacterium]
MIKLTPSLLAADLMHLGREIEKMMENGIDQLHFDVMDAHFVPNLSFGPAFCQAIHKHFPTLKIDVHLMMDNPEAYLDVFAKSGASSITVHREVLSDPAAMIEAIRARGVTCGFSIKPETDVNTLLPWLDQLDHILIMTVEPGFGGQAFMPEEVEKIKALRSAGFRGDIAVDGGVGLQNLELLIGAGANWLVMGTAYFCAEDPKLVAMKVKEYA